MIYKYGLCSGLTSVTIPEGVTSIGSGAFHDCSGLTSVTINSNDIMNESFTLKTNKKPEYTLGDYFPTGVSFFYIGGNVTSIADYAFYWYPTSCNVILQSNNINKIGKNHSFGSAHILCNNGTRTLFTCWEADIIPYEFGSGTKLYKPYLSWSTTPTSVAVEMLYCEHENIRCEIVLNGSTFYSNLAELRNLYPGEITGYSVDLSLRTQYSHFYLSGRNSTRSVEFTNLQPKVISIGNVIVSSDTNIYELYNENEKVGFEWRRTDWTDDFPSNTGIAYLYEGTMEGYIRNLNTDKLWKFRPYYIDKIGKYHYGDWMGLDPTNTSYFEPTVHTYAKIEVEGNTALVKGYALNGTDKIAVQGFKYWKSSNKANGMSMAPAKAPAIPGSAQTVEAEGRVMEATLSGLDYETDYSYVAFVKTTEGETFYGDVRSFTTGVNTSGIDTAATTDSSVEVVGIYDLQGHRQHALRPGINIVRYSDGTAKKVMIRR